MNELFEALMTQYRLRAPPQAEDISHMTGPQRSLWGRVYLLGMWADVCATLITGLFRNVCGCHWYLLHRLGGLRPELAELAWSSPLCTQLQQTRQEANVRAGVRGRWKVGV